MSEMDFAVGLDDASVRFTPDGRISVLDAIKALTLSDRPELIWEKLKRDHPEIARHSRSYPFLDSGSLPVLDGKGWELVWMLLIDYVVKPERLAEA
jgi:hypothetical protein